jgi:hypothetical protein
MFARLFAPPSAMRRPRLQSTSTKALCIAAIASLGLLVTACTATTRPVAGADPSDPTVRVPAATYRSVVGGYLSRRPAEPAPWREQNQRVAPKTDE